MARYLLAPSDPPSEGRYSCHLLRKSPSALSLLVVQVHLGPSLDPRPSCTTVFSEMSATDLETLETLLATMPNNPDMCMNIDRLSQME